MKSVLLTGVLLNIFAFNAAVQAISSESYSQSMNRDSCTLRFTYNNDTRNTTWVMDVRIFDQYNNLLYSSPPGEKMWRVTIHGRRYHELRITGGKTGLCHGIITYNLDRKFVVYSEVDIHLGLSRRGSTNSTYSLNPSAVDLNRVNDVVVECQAEKNGETKITTVFAKARQQKVVKKDIIASNSNCNTYYYDTKMRDSGYIDVNLRKSEIFRGVVKFPYDFTGIETRVIEFILPVNEKKASKGLPCFLICNKSTELNAYLELRGTMYRNNSQTFKGLMADESGYRYIGKANYCKERNHYRVSTIDASIRKLLNGNKGELHLVLEPTEVSKRVLFMDFFAKNDGENPNYSSNLKSMLPTMSIYYDAWE